MSFPHSVSKPNGVYPRGRHLHGHSDGTTREQVGRVHPRLVKPRTKGLKRPRRLLDWCFRLSQPLRTLSSSGLKLSPSPPPTAESEQSEWKIAMTFLVSSPKVVGWILMIRLMHSKLKVAVC